MNPIKWVRGIPYRFTANACTKRRMGRWLGPLGSYVERRYRMRESCKKNPFCDMKPVLSEEILEDYREAERDYERSARGEELEEAIHQLIVIISKDTESVYKDFPALLGDCYMRKREFEKAFKAYDDARCALLWMDMQANSSKLEAKLEEKRIRAYTKCEVEDL